MGQSSIWTRVSLWQLLLAALLSILAVLGPLALAAVADAPPSPPPGPISYDCQVIVIAKDIPSGSAAFKYMAIADGGVHGGQAYNFVAATHKISVLSDGRWLAISWMRGDQNVAEGTFARSDYNQGAETLVIANPQDANEQVSVDCTKKP